MNRRKFLETMNYSVAALMASQLFHLNCRGDNVDKQITTKNWAWLQSIFDYDTDESIYSFLSKLKSNGIDAVLPQIYNSTEALFDTDRLPVRKPLLQKIIKHAKKLEMEVHAWMWMMPCNIKSIQEQHPQWFAVNGRGESTLDAPAYVDYYKFMCPNQPGVREFLKKNIEEVAEYQDLDGIHFDYIRFPDVILAKNLQPKYGIVQDREYPQYDYCYCDVCREKFESKTGIDPMNLDDPSKNQEWLKFRFDSITSLVKDVLVPAAKISNKHVSAAVFPNWKHVRQEWWKWGLDSVMPMLYHRFYDEGIDWIQDNIKYGLKVLPQSTSLYSGLEVGAFSPQELALAIEKSVEAGAKGVTFFNGSAMTDEHWSAVSELLLR